MDKYMKNFVSMSLIWLGLAVIFGIIMGVNDATMQDVFAHTHFNLLGFMSMMVFGIGYFIIPRFNGVATRFPSWIPLHFWLANISLGGMVLFNYLSLTVAYSPWHELFIIMATVQAISIFLFVINLLITLNSKPAPIQQKATASPPTKKPEMKPTPKPPVEIIVNGKSKVADLIDNYPVVMNVLTDAGVGALGMPGHIDKVREMGITLGMLANNHKLDISHLIKSIKDAVESDSTSQSTSQEPEAIKVGAVAETSSGEKIEITKDTNIGEIMKAYPESEKVFAEHFGSGCFDCPGQLTESIELACSIHDVNPDEFVIKLKELLE